jgi:hypothetical protein
MATIKGAQGGGFLTQKQVIEMLYARSMRVLRGLENESVDRLMKKYRTAQDRLVATLFNLYGDTDGWTYQQWVDSGKMRALLQAVETVLSDLQQAADTEIGRGAQVQFFQSYDQTSWALDQSTPPNTPVRYARPPEDAVRVLTNTPYKGAMFSQRIGMITDAMASDIRDELTQSLILGEDMTAAATRVQKVIGITNQQDPRSYANRARVIARSEIMRAQNMARDFTYEQNKDLIEDGETIWVVAPDDRLCRWCFRREGLTDAEIEASSPEDDPWGNDTEAPLHPNCRCTKEPKLKSWKDLIGLDMPENLKGDYRGMRNDSGRWEIAPIEKFEDWKAAKGVEFAAQDTEEE